MQIRDEFVGKIILVGAKGVGKTLLWSRYSRGTIPNPNIPTKTQSKQKFESRDVEIDGKEIKLLIWDTSGQPQ